MTNPVTAFKSLAPSEYTVTPFAAYAPFSYTYVSGSSTNSLDVQILLGRKYVTSSGLRVANTEQDLFDSVVQTFYSPIPYTQYGIQSSSYHPTSSVFVVSVTQDVFGEEIKPGTFTVKINTSSSIDDGRGNLIVSQSGTGSIVGRIFYDKGVAVIKPTSSIAGGGLTRNGICIVSGTNVVVNFTSSVQLNEHSVKVKLNPTDFNFSLYNPTVTKTFYTYTGSTTRPFDSMVTRSITLDSTNYLVPYITTIGLYNSNSELVAIAKVSNPIQRTFDSIQTFVVKFDT
jgi:hypothetical protein